MFKGSKVVSIDEVSCNDRLGVSPLRVPRGFVSRKEEASDQVMISNTNLNMGFAVEAGIFVYGFAFDEGGSDRFEGNQFLK